MPLHHAIRAAVDRALYGRSTVDCEECGVSLPAHLAIWRGLHPYCSTDHEHRDGAAS